jgi:hypothetical protein
MLETLPDISELLTTAPIALILLIFIWLVFKLIHKIVSEYIKLMSLFISMTEKLIEVLKDLKKIELN